MKGQKHPLLTLKFPHISLHSSQAAQIVAMEAPLSTSYLLHLPSHVLMEILSRLPIKALVTLKSVCKSWLNLVSSDTLFAQLHHQRSPTELLIRPKFNASSTSTKLYFGNIQSHQNRVHYVNHSLLFDLLDFKFRKANNMDRVMFINSCNGLVCFSCLRSRDIVISNPFTGEFITLPMGSRKMSMSSQIVNYGLGFSEKESRFKLLRVVYSPTLGTQSAEICTFEKGSSSWRDVGDCPYPIIGSRGYVFLEGKLHFDSAAYGKVGDSIPCFDFDKEEFRVVPTPSGFHEALKYDVAFGVFGGCLFLSRQGALSYEIWVMKEYGVENSWTKMFSIPCEIQGNVRPLVPVKELDNGEILVLSEERDELFSYDPDENSIRTIRLGDDSHSLRVIADSPTLLRLKDALAGYEACIHNVDSREEKLVAQSPRQGSEPSLDN